MLIFDAHLDLALNAIDWNRDMRLDLEDLRAQERDLRMEDPGRCHSTLTYPELKNAGIGVCLATLLARQEKEINHSFGHTTPEACYAVAHAHLAYYRAMERGGWMKKLTTRTDLDAHVAACHEGLEQLPLGYILTMEGADPLLTPATIEEFHAEGLRAIGLTHYGANRYGGGTRSEVGLAVDAIELLERIERLGITVDMTHLSDVAFWQVARKFGGRVHASHQNSRRLCNWQRQFTDDQYRFVIERGGVIGIAMDVIMLQPGYVRGISKPEVTLERAVDNIDLICQLAGNSDNVGIGSDLDGGYGYEQTPADLNRISDLQHRLPDLLRNRGYSNDDLEKIFHRNWVRFFGDVLDH